MNKKKYIINYDQHIIDKCQCVVFMIEKIEHFGT